MLEKVTATRLIFTTPNFGYLGGGREAATGDNDDGAQGDCATMGSLA